MVACEVLANDNGIRSDMTDHLQHSTTPDTAAGNVSVFVVDDHAGYRSLVAEVVAATDGFTFLSSAACWADAARAFAAGESVPDLVLMDVNLGEDSGVEATKELRKRWPQVKVVLISTLAAADLPADASSCGAVAYLAKSQLSPEQITLAWRGSYDWEQ